MSGTVSGRHAREEPGRAPEASGATPPADEDWAILVAAARTVRDRSYSPYSRYPVGAAARTDSGRIVTGCNVENASFGLTLCAECGVLSQLHATGGGRITALVCVDAADVPILPCGRCRQLLVEHADPETPVLSPEGPIALGELLPHQWKLTEPTQHGRRAR